MSKPTSFSWTNALRERICPVCRRHVPEGEGVIHAPLTVVIHAGKCNDLATVVTATTAVPSVADGEAIGKCAS